MFTSAVIFITSLATALMLGGGLYESMILSPQWSADPPSSFRIIQPSTGVPLQRFWIPLHVFITLSLALSLVATWGNHPKRTLIVCAAMSYLLMRAWSFIYFIPEMLRFQRIPLNEPPTEELRARVRLWTTHTWGRHILDLVTYCFLLNALLAR
jgi:hypothetical protein